MKMVIIIIWILCTIFLIRSFRGNIMPDTEMFPIPRVIGYVDMPHAIVAGGGGNAQNVHDSNVREIIWNKYNRLASTITTNILELRKDIHNTSIFQPHCTPAQYTKILSVINNIKHDNTIIDNNNVRHYEIDIYSYVFHKYKSLNIDWSAFIGQMVDCVDEDGSFMCITGRVSRYISVFEGLDLPSADEYLSKTEITSDLLYQDAINRTQILLEDYMNKNEELKRVYNGQGSEEEEERLEVFLTKIRKRIKNKLLKEYKLPESQINTLIEGI